MINDQWTTEDGQVIKIENLEDSHLATIINFLRKRHNQIRTNTILKINRLWPGELTDSIRERLDLWSEFLAEAEVDEVLDNLVPSYRNLLIEAKKRGLGNDPIVGIDLSYLDEEPLILGTPDRFLIEDKRNPEHLKQGMGTCEQFIE